MREPSASEHLEGFLHHLAHERRLSSHTLSSYRRDLTRMSDWIDGEGRGPWERLDQETVRRYVAWRHRGGAFGPDLRLRSGQARLPGNHFRGRC